MTGANQSVYAQNEKGSGMGNMSWGVNSAHGTLKSVLMYRPDTEIDVVTNENKAVFNFDGPVDRETFQAEYDVMISAFDDHGVEPVFLADVLRDDEDSLNFIKHRPNMTIPAIWPPFFKRELFLWGRISSAVGVIRILWDVP